MNFKQKRDSFGVLTAVSLAAAALASTSAFAQTAPPQAENETVGLEEIIVQARKVNENLQDVPVAVTAFTGEQLEAQNVPACSGLRQLYAGPSHSRRSVDSLGPDAHSAWAGANRHSCDIGSIGWHLWSTEYTGRAHMVSMPTCSTSRAFRCSKVPKVHCSGAIQRAARCSLTRTRLIWRTSAAKRRSLMGASTR